MWKPIYQPDPWPKFVKRKDIIGLPLMEQRRKFMEEQILFENYVSSINTINTVSTAAAGAAGGPAPGGGGDPSPSPTPNPNLPLNNLSLSVVSAAGLRQLTSSYSGPLIRVRRNDETELDIAFIPSSGDLDTGSLIDFVGTGSSDIGRVTKMYNQSGRPSIPYTYSSGGVLVTGQTDLDWISENRGVGSQFFNPPVIIVSGTLNRNQDGKVFLASNSDANYDEFGSFRASYMSMKIIGSDQASAPYYASGLISGDNMSNNPGRYRSLYVVAQMDPQNNTEANYVDKYSVGYVLGLDTENNTPQLDNKRIGFKVAGYGTDAFSDMFNPYLKPYFSFGTVPTGSDANDNVLVLNTASYAAPGSNGVQGIGYVAGVASNTPPGPTNPVSGSKSVDRFFEAVIFEDVANSATSSLYDNISTYYNF